MDKSYTCELPLIEVKRFPACANKLVLFLLHARKMLFQQVLNTQIRNFTFDFYLQKICCKTIYQKT